jgi:hypothetical protein
MNLPAIVTNAALQKLADPSDTHEVHVIVRRIANAAPYTLRGRRRQYIVTRCQVRGAHILKVPLSLWMGGCRQDKPVMENDSICYDLQGSRTGLKSPLTFEVWPVEGKQKTSAVEPVSNFSIPGPGPHPQGPAGVSESTDPAPLSNKERQAAYRARKRAEKEAAEALKLQTA